MTTTTATAKSIKAITILKYECVSDTPCLSYMISSSSSLETIKKTKNLPPTQKKTLLPHFFCFCFALWFDLSFFRMGLCIRMNLGGPDFLSFAPPSHMFWKSSFYFKLWQHMTASDVNKKQVHQILSSFLATEEKS
jgi:hypothetical protein